MEQQPLFDLSEYESQPQLGDDYSDPLSAELGAADAAAVREALGGLEIKLPRTCQGVEYTRLVELVGNHLADRLVEKFAGEELYINKNCYPRANDKHLQIYYRFRELKASNPAHKALQLAALEFKLSERWVRSILFRIEHGGL